MIITIIIDIVISGRVLIYNNVLSLMLLLYKWYVFLSLELMKHKYNGINNNSIYQVYTYVKKIL